MSVYTQADEELEEAAKAVTTAIKHLSAEYRQKLKDNLNKMLEIREGLE